MKLSSYPNWTPSTPRQRQGWYINRNAEPPELRALQEFRHLSPAEQEADEVRDEVIALLERKGILEVADY